ncbi:hypothetical protein FJZ55_07330 [Candidatus Woesearchaeota archaeon]|nr:hypothetical protein [Candidatus Woesearchaeota archaeon]
MKSRKFFKKDLIVADYIHFLSQEEIDTLFFEKKENFVIGCGVDKNNHLYLIDQNLSIKKIVPNGNWIPISAKPLKQGRFIEVFFQNGNTFNINSLLALNSGIDCFQNNEILINNKKVFEINI